MLNAAGPFFMIVYHWKDTITPHNACRLLQYLKLYLLQGLLMLFHPLFSMFWAHSHYTLKGNQLPPKNSKKGYHLSVLNLLHAHPENTFLAISTKRFSRYCINALFKSRPILIFRQKNASESLLKRFCLSRRLPIFTRRFQRTIFGTSELNFCVRNGNRWNLTVIDTDRSDWPSITYMLYFVQCFLEGRAFKTE